MKKKRLHRGFRSQSLSDKLFDILNYGLLGLFALIILYPMYFIIIASFSDPVAINNGQISF